MAQAARIEDLPPTQFRLLLQIPEVCGNTFDHSSENLGDLGEATGLKRGELIREMLALQYKGFLKRAPPLTWGKPRGWIVVFQEPAPESLPSAPE